MNATANRQRQQRQIVVLVVLLAVLGVIVAIQVLPLMGDSRVPPAPAPQPTRAPVATPPAPTAPSRSAGNAASRGSAASRGGAPAPGAPASASASGAPGGVEEVHLAKLNQPEPEPIEGHRNPFSLAPEPKPASAATKAAPPPTPVAPPPPVATGPPPPPPAPPITLKFFGVVSAGRVGKIAALGDGKFVYYGREGSIIDGRYRIVKIGEESIQLEYADGRGRQTIRLSGK